MNPSRIAALARRVARRHTAGLIKPPPAMVEAIYKWAAACLALSEMERREKYRQEHEQNVASGGYDRQAALRKLEELLAQVRKTPTKWKVYSEYAKASMMFGYGPWGSIPFKSFTKLTPEGEERLRKWVEKDLRAAEERIANEWEQERESLAREVADKAKLQRIVSEGSAYNPGIVPQTREFPLDLTGWKYDVAKFQALLEKQHGADVKVFEDALGKVREESPEQVPLFESLLDNAKKSPKWRTITVILSNDIGKGSGSWQETTKTLRILATDTPLLNDPRDPLDRLHDIVYHELQHMTQSLMAYALWSAEAVYAHSTNRLRPTQPGFPRPDARTPQYKQQGTPTREVGADALHALDDVEFHTDLQGEVALYKRTLARHPDLTSEQKQTMFDHFTSRRLAPREWGKWNPPVDTSKFFTVLKRHAPRKYVEAVKELAAAVL